MLRNLSIILVKAFRVLISPSAFFERLLYDFRLLFLQVVVLFQVMVEHIRRKPLRLLPKSSHFSRSVEI